MTPEPREAREPLPHLPGSERELVAAAWRAAGELFGRSEEIAAARRLPADVVRRFASEGFFRLCLPRSLGGPECHPETLVRVLEALACGDGAAGWCAAIASTSSVLAGYLEPAPARTIFAAPGAVAGGVFAPHGRARRVPGGFRVTGRWSFASGCEHCSWLMGGCQIEGDGGPERAPGGGPDVRLLLFPAQAAEIVDTWQVLGLEGTGSHDIAVRDLEVPEAHSVSLLSDRPREAGPLFAFPAFGLLAVGVASVALGLARRALLELGELACRKTPTLARRRLAERAATQTGLAAAEAGLGGGRSFLLATVREAWERAGSAGPLPLEDRARVRLAATHAVRTSTFAVDRLYELGGGSAIYRESPLQRLFRDVHVLTQHAMVAEPSLELVGRVLLGVDVDASLL